jgi:hypothetical protein
MRFVLWPVVAFALVVFTALFGFKAVGAVDRRAELLFAANPDTIPWAAAGFLIVGVVAWFISSHAARRFREYGAAQTIAADDPEIADSPLRPTFWRTLANALFPLVAASLLGALILLSAGWFFEQGRERVEGATVQFEYGTVQATLFSDGSAQCHLGLDELPCVLSYKDDERFNELLGSETSWVVSFGDLEGDGSNFVFAWTHAGPFTVANFGDMNAEGTELEASDAE